MLQLLRPISLPHYMSDDVFAMFVIVVISLVVITVLTAAIAFAENRRARTSTRLLQESRLRAYELDPEGLETSNRELRERVAWQSATITQSRHLLDTYGAYVDRLVAGGAVLTEPKPEVPAEVQLVHPATGLPLRKQPENKVPLFSAVPEPAGS